MEEAKAIMGILLVAAISVTAFFVINAGGTGLVVEQNYIACCCNILTSNGQQTVVRSQVQTFEKDCNTACKRYEDYGKVFPQEGLCTNE